jgi:8-oxo-dGTP pyrophosphatase MutT (NUDIX family)
VGRHETPQSAIKREVLEELGVEIKVLDLMHAERSEFGISLDLVYLCRLVDFPLEFRMSREVTGAEFYDWDRLPLKQMVHQHAALIHQLARRYNAR